MKSLLLLLLLLACTPLMHATPGLAEGAAPAEGYADNLDHTWVLICAALVFFMQAGFMLLELGLTRAKNAINIVMKNVLDFAVAAIFFFGIGFGVMFGPSLGSLLGTGPFFPSTESGFSWSFLIFQLMFCGTAATIASGAMAERTKFMGYLAYTVLVSAFIYPIYGHWVWNEQGWLHQLGLIDFAGGSVVHMVGGACALAGIMVVGPRVGRFGPDGQPRLIVGHNMPLAALGVFILWFGWLGFNAGSALKVDETLGLILLNTVLASSAGSIVSMFSMWKVHGRPDPGITLNGALGGLVAITPCCHVVNPNAAIVIGLIAGLLTTWSTILMERTRLDDGVGAVPVHLVNGIWGMWAVALFNQAGFSWHSLGVQMLGTLACFLFAFISAWIVFKLVNATIGLRAKDHEQEEGLDFHEHSATAYPDFATNDQTLN